MEFINLIEKVARTWMQKYTNYPLITVRDISHQSGGPWPDVGTCKGHSQHQNGLEADIRIVRNDGSSDGIDRFSSFYSPERTQQLVDLFQDLGNINKIFFNDPNIVGVESRTGHDDHLHIWINDPDGDLN